MVNKIMYQKIQYFKRKGFTRTDIIRETGLNKRAVLKYYSMSEKKYSRYIEKVRYRTKILETLALRIYLGEQHLIVPGEKEIIQRPQFGSI